MSSSTPPTDPIAERWYVVRYKNLSHAAREILNASPLEVFLPLRTTNKYDDARRGLTATEQPLVRGYIFVRGTLTAVKELARQLGYALWQQRDRHTEHTAYVSIRDEEMAPFRRAVEILTLDFQLFSAEHIDPQADDQVVVLEGQFAGVRGYLKTSQGSKNGLVVVPLQFKTSAADTAPPDTLSPQSPLCYGLNVPTHQLGIVAFAPGNRHARDMLLSQRRHVDRAIDQHRSQGHIDPTLRERLASYLQRFADVRLDSLHLRAQHVLMCYRIYALLGLRANQAATNAELRELILPALQARADAATKRGSTTAARDLAAFIDCWQSTTQLFPLPLA